MRNLIELGPLIYWISSPYLSEKIWKLVIKLYENQGISLLFYTIIKSETVKHGQDLVITLIQCYTIMLVFSSLNGVLLSPRSIMWSNMLCVVALCGLVKWVFNYFSHQNHFDHWCVKKKLLLFSNEVCWIYTKYFLFC